MESAQHARRDVTLRTRAPEGRCGGNQRKLGRRNGHTTMPSISPSHDVPASNVSAHKDAAAPTNPAVTGARSRVNTPRQCQLRAATAQLATEVAVTSAACLVAPAAR